MFNLSFEIADGSFAGVPSGWVFSAHSQYAYAPFHTVIVPFEDFEREWNSNESYKFAFTGIGADLTKAPFGAAGVATVETFEKEWSGNEAYQFGLAGVDAEFDTSPEPFEDFEEDWGTVPFHYSFVGVGTDLTAAAFDVSPENFEDFEENWVASYKDAFVGVGTDLTAATFDSGTHAFENFEGTWFTMVTI